MTYMRMGPPVIEWGGGPLLLDLFCGAGGAAAGYNAAGFNIIGVDIEPQLNYPYEFIQDDALTVLDELVTNGCYQMPPGQRQNRRCLDVSEISALHGSPPCQGYSRTQRLTKKVHPKLIEPVRGRFQQLALPYVIENVIGAPLLEPTLLCGQMFELGTYRHRNFETNFPVVPKLHTKHRYVQAKLGRRPEPGQYMEVVGHFAGMQEACEAMQIGWMKRAELTESIPPAYTAYIGEYLLAKVLSLKA